MTSTGLAIQRQSAIAELGELALRGISLDELIAQVVRTCTDLLPTDFVSVIELLPTGDELVVRAAEGWPGGLVHELRIPNDLESQSGFTLQTDEPVIVDDLEKETRFQVPQLLVDHAVRSGVTVVVRGSGRPYGVLGVQSKTPGAFDTNDAQFVRSVANVLGSAVQRQIHENELSSLVEISRVIASSSDITNIFPLFAECVAELI